MTKMLLNNVNLDCKLLMTARDDDKNNSFVDLMIQDNRNRLGVEMLEYLLEMKKENKNGRRSGAGIEFNHNKWSDW